MRAAGRSFKPSLTDLAFASSSFLAREGLALILLQARLKSQVWSVRGQLYTLLYIFIHKYVYVYVCVCVPIYIYIFMFTYSYLYLHLYVCVHVCIHIYAGIISCLVLGVCQHSCVCISLATCLSIIVYLIFYFIMCLSNRLHLHCYPACIKCANATYVFICWSVSKKTVPHSLLSLSTLW